MSNKLKRDNFSIRELEEIAEALDCYLKISFEKIGPCYVGVTIKPIIFIWSNCNYSRALSAR